MVLDDIASLLQDAGLGTPGSTIFKGRLPPDPPGPAVADEIVALFAVPGPGPRHVHDIAGPAVEQPAVQVRCRGRASPGGYAALWAKAHQAYVLLDSVSNMTINGTFYERIMALGSLHGALGEDEYQRPSLAFTVLCIKAP